MIMTGNPTGSVQYEELFPPVPTIPKTKEDLVEEYNLPQKRQALEVVAALPTGHLEPLVDRVCKRWEDGCGIVLETDLGITKQDLARPEGFVLELDKEDYENTFAGYYDPESGLTHIDNHGHDMSIGQMIHKAIEKGDNIHRTMIHEEGHSRVRTDYDFKGSYYFKPNTIIEELFADLPASIILADGIEGVSSKVSNHPYVWEQYGGNSENEKSEMAYKDIKKITEKVFALKALGLGSLQIEKLFFDRYQVSKLWEMDRESISDFVGGVNGILDDLLVENCPDELKGKDRKEKVTWLNSNFTDLVKKAEDDDIRIGTQMREVLLQEAERYHTEVMSGTLAADIPLKLGTKDGVVLGNITTNERGEKEVLLSEYEYRGRKRDQTALTKLEILKYDPSKGYSTMNDILTPIEKIRSHTTKFLDSLEDRSDDEFTHAMKNVQIDTFWGEPSMHNNSVVARLADEINLQLENIDQPNYMNRIIQEEARMKQSTADLTLTLLRPRQDSHRGFDLSGEQYQRLHEQIAIRCSEWQKAYPDMDMRKVRWLTKVDTEQTSSQVHAWANLSDFYSSYKQGTSGKNIVSGFLTAINGYYDDENIDQYVRAMVSDLAAYTLQEASRMRGESQYGKNVNLSNASMNYSMN